MASCVYEIYYFSMRDFLIFHYVLNIINTVTMQASQPCDLCGCKEVNLHDGFYFCAECGTQDSNVRETIIEAIDKGGGDFLRGYKKKTVKIVEENKQMSDTWYKWHAFNFLLNSIADELLEYGAKPSFKTKLLWVWTRYLKKYLKKEDLGLKEKPCNQSMPQSEEDSDSDEDKPPEDLLATWDANRDKHIKGFSFTLLVTLVFIALNLDKSVITLTHLIKLFRDGLLSVPYRIDKVVPKELKPEKLYLKIRKGMVNFKCPYIRIIAMTLFKRLDLGNPVVPDLRIIMDNHFKELCLPNDLKPLVLSLMHYKPCSFLDVNSKDRIIYKVPAYEFHVMTYIIWALKLCLGLDCDYEVKLSKAAEAINENEDRPMSHFYNGESAPTNRLFSFCEWVTFFQFRQTLLRHYCFRYANKCSWDTDDYTALEHHMDVLDCVWEKDLKDEMAYDLLNRLKGGMVESMVIPKSELKPTLTPFNTYTQVIAQHLQDPEVKVRLTEDFTQYSLKYVIDDWNLVNPNSKEQKNLVKGIQVDDKVVKNKFLKFRDEIMLPHKMVYVRNCENHNWLTTKPPTLDHVVCVDKLDESDDDANEEDINTTQNGLDNLDNNIPDSEMNGVHSKSHSTSDVSLTNSTISNGIQFIDETKILESNKLNASEKEKWSDCSINNSTFSNRIRFIDETKVFESGKLDKTEIDKLKNMNDKLANPNEIKEEDEGVNIFDDDFKPEIKEEVHSDCVMDYENTFNVSENHQDVPCINEINRENDNDSVVSSLDSVNFNEATFDRAKTIKEIILYTCKQHKLPVPSEYNPKLEKRKEMGIFARKLDTIVALNKKKRDIKRNRGQEIRKSEIWKAYVTDYIAAMQDDILNQIAQKVKTAIENAQNAPPNEDNLPLDTNAMEVDATSNHSDVIINEPSEQASGVRSQITNESDEERLFSEESDGETNAKELLPEKNPEFEEEDYDTSQLYVKTVKTAEHGEMELDPRLYGIIKKKMKKDRKDPSLLTWTEERKKLVRPDSEDEMPLSVLRELKEFTIKLSNQDKKTLDPFLKEKIKDFHYWFMFYKNMAGCSYNTEFDKKAYEELPKSILFVLNQCALILGSTAAELYKNLQSFEMTAAEKSKFNLNEHHLRSHVDLSQI